MTPMYNIRDYSKTERKKALENVELHHNRPGGAMAANGGMIVKAAAVKKDGNPIAPEELRCRFDQQKHAIEPDYK